MDAGLTVSRLMTMEANVGFMFSDTLVSTAVLSAFGALASILAAVGLYGVLSAYVNQRRREFAVRSAVGATPGDLRRQVLAESTRLTLTGAVLGLLLSLVLARLLATQLVDMKADYQVFLWAGLGTAVAAILSSIVPTRRASRMDPASALRCE
jgi:ABC-type antimicrobial peptide transport system permease subunit